MGRDGPAGFDLVGVGQVSLDHVDLVDVMPDPGGKGTLRETRVLPGGQVATALLAAQRLGLRCAFVGAVGDDAAGQAALAPLRRAGMELGGVREFAGVPTRQARVLVDAGTGERTIFERRDAALWLGAKDVPAVVEHARAVLVDGEHPAAARAAIERAQGAGVPVLLDVDQAHTETLKMARSVEFPIVSEGFAAELSDGAFDAQVLPQLVGPHTRIAVITRGDRGSLAWIDGAVVETPARSVDVRDTTGAGDVFRGAFAWAWLEGWAPERVLEWANAAAAWSCRGVGAQGALPSRDELEREGSR